PSQNGSAPVPILMSRRFSSAAVVGSDASHHQVATMIAKAPMSAAPLNAPRPAARPARIRCRFTISKRRDRTVPLADRSAHRLSCGIRCQFKRSRSRGRAPRVQLLLCCSKLESTVRDLNMKNHELLDVHSSGCHKTVISDAFTLRLDFTVRGNDLT